MPSLEPDFLATTLKRPLGGQPPARRHLRGAMYSVPHSSQSRGGTNVRDGRMLVPSDDLGQPAAVRFPS